MLDIFGSNKSLCCNGAKRRDFRWTDAQEKATQEILK